MGIEGDFKEFEGKIRGNWSEFQRDSSRLAMVFRPLAVPATASRGFRTEKTAPTAAFGFLRDSRTYIHTYAYMHRDIANIESNSNSIYKYI